MSSNTVVPKESKKIRKETDSLGKVNGVAEHCQDRSNAYAGGRVSNALK